MDIENFVSKYIDMLKPVGIITKKQADERAADFLYAIAIISTERRNLKEDLVLIKSSNMLIYGQVFGEIKGTPTEKKASAQGNGKYIEVRETLETIEANIDYLKTLEDTFNNAHIYYRNLYRGE